MQTSQKLDEPRQAARAAESNNHQKEAGLTLTATQSWLLVIGILILFGALLFWGYNDWQRQREMSQEFEKHLRSLPISKANEEERARGLESPRYAHGLENPTFSQQ